MSWNYYGFRPYVPVAQRRANAQRELAKLTRKTGLPVSPVTLEGRAIARTFWGKAWCENLEAYSDFANRLPRGRTYVRNGSVVDLQIEPGKITARVAGSDLYTIQIRIKPLETRLWKSIQTDCAGKIDSLMELLQGRLSSAVMQIVTRPQQGLFPAPREIDMDCSCPDWAGLCKHVAATLYGVGARLDQQPELLFRLRGVDPAELISRASASEAIRQSGPAQSAPAMTESELADVFGIDLAPSAATPAAPAGVGAGIELRGTPPVPPETERPIPPAGVKLKREQPAKVRRQLNSPTRNKIAAAAKARWAKLKTQMANGKQPAPRKPRRSNKRRVIRRKDNEN